MKNLTAAKADAEHSLKAFTSAFVQFGVTEETNRRLTDTVHAQAEYTIALVTELNRQHNEPVINGVNHPPGP